MQPPTPPPPAFNLPHHHPLRLCQITGGCMQTYSAGTDTEKKGNNSVYLRTTGTNVAQTTLHLAHLTAGWLSPLLKDRPAARKLSFTRAGPQQSCQSRAGNYPQKRLYLRAFADWLRRPAVAAVHAGHGRILSMTALVSRRYD